MRIEVIVGDATETAGDVLALKYAQAWYGLDKRVADRLRQEGRRDAEMSQRRLPAQNPPGPQWSGKHYFVNWKRRGWLEGRCDRLPLATEGALR